MKRLLTFASLLLVLNLGVNVFAGQAACRFEYPVAVTCFGEETVFSLYNFEIATGAELSYRGEVTLTPYTAFAWYDTDWFAVLETRLPMLINPFETRFSLSLTVGMVW